MKLINSTVIDSDTTIDLTYSPNDIKSDKGLSSEINWSEDTNENKSDSKKSEEKLEDGIIKVAKISETIDNAGGEKEVVFSNNTEVPIIPVDMYSSSIDKIELLDIDFFDSSNTNTNKLWRLIKSYVDAFGHAILYISAALLLTTLIWRSMLLVLSSAKDNPIKAAESRKKMDKIFSAIIMMVGVYIIMTLMINFYQNVLGMILEEDNTYLIRAEVENTYSFDTNVIGLLKYMTLNTNIKTSLWYSLLYVFMAFINFVYFGIMVARMVVIAFLITIAPLTAAKTMIKNSVPRQGFHIENFLDFNSWLRMYTVFVWFPLLMIIIQRLAIYIS